MMSVGKKTVYFPHWMSLPYELKLSNAIDMLSGITLKSKCFKLLLTTKALGSKCTERRGLSLLLSSSV